MATRGQTKQRCRLGLLVGSVAAAFLFAGGASADDIPNNLDATVDAVAEVMALNAGGASGTTQLRVVTQNGDGKNGCNLTGGTTLVVSVTSSNPSAATVSPTSVTFTSCGATPTLTVTPHAPGSATISLAQTSNNTGGTFNLAPATFTVNVTAPTPANTAPSVSLGGVTGGSSYAKGAVPAATCQVTDAEDGASSFGATLSAISGPYSANGVGQQTASCSYTDAGGLTASASETYSIVDSSAPSIGYVLGPATPDGLNGWYRGGVTLTWTVDDPESSLTKTGCADQAVSADQAANEYSCSATSAGGTTGPVTVTIKRDGTAPTVSCGAADALWHADDVAIACSAFDTLSQLLDSADASFVLTTSVADGTETDVAATGSRSVADGAGNASVAGPIGGNKVDKKAPTITCDAAPSGWSANDASIVCNAGDGGSGLAAAGDASFTLTTSVAAGVETDDAVTGSRDVADAVGNTASAGPVGGARVDKRAPTVACDAAPTSWSAVDVSIGCTASDGGSGLANDLDASFALSTSVAAGEETAGAATPSRVVEDKVGNAATAGPIAGLKVDRKKPTIACDAVPTTWSADNVSIACTASDGGSGLADSGDAVFGLSTTVDSGAETDAASTGSRSVADAVGNTATAGPLTGLKIDRKAPVVTCDDAPLGWSATDVSIACTAADAGSGLANAGDASFSLKTTVTPGAETAGAETAWKWVVDHVGNQTAAGPISGVRVDKKAPTVACGSADGAWHAANVAVACTAADGGSGLANAADASFQLETNVAAGTETSNAATNARSVADAVGNAASAGPVFGNRIDRKAPTVTPVCPGTVLLGSSAAASWTAADGGSGVVAGHESGTVTVDSSSVGTKTATVPAGASEDAVGNASAVATCTYAVIYRWAGFFQPVDNLPTQNAVKAGSAVPVKFSLGGYQGMSVLAAGYPTSNVATCDASAADDPLELTLTAGSSGLNYDAATDQYLYVWKTDKAWAGQCRQLRVKLVDGTLHAANFKLK